jgi:hypothetical protein
MRIPGTIRYDGTEYTIGSEPIVIDSADLSGDLLDNDIALLMLKYIVAPFSPKNFTNITKNLKHFLNWTLLEDAQDENDMEFSAVEYEQFVKDTWRQIEELTPEQFYKYTKGFASGTGDSDPYVALMTNLSDKAKTMQMKDVFEKIGYEWLASAHKVKSKKGTELYVAGENVLPYRKALKEVDTLFNVDDNDDRKSTGIKGSIHHRKFKRKGWKHLLNETEEQKDRDEELLDDEDLKKLIKEQNIYKYMHINVTEEVIANSKKTGKLSKQKVIIKINFDEVIADIMSQQGIHQEGIVSAGNQVETMARKMTDKEWLSLFTGD